MTDATLLLPSDYAEQRARLREERQARVGILRNPNAPPRPPTRKTNLMGKWINLRSSRRPRPGQVKTAVEALFADVGVPTDQVDTVVHTAQDGTVQSIDIAHLMQSVARIGKSQPTRTPYGHSMRPDREAPALPPAPAPEPSILSREAWLDEDMHELAQRVRGNGDEVDEVVADEALTLADKLRAGLLTAMRFALRGVTYLFVGLVLALVLLGIASGLMG